MRIRFCAWVGVALVLALGAMPAAARTVPDFDQPVKTVTVTVPEGVGDYQWDITCFYYSDIIVRTPDSDTPSPGDSEIAPRSADIAATQCGGHSFAGSVKLASDGYALDGRKGGFIFFEFSDPTGASKFKIFDALTGRTLFADGFNQYQTVSLSQGILHLHYNRGMNTKCSLLTDRTGCWNELLASGIIPRGAFAGPPPREACLKSYGAEPITMKSPDPHVAPVTTWLRYTDDDPSLVSYDALLTLDRAGHAKVQPTGPLQCDPQP